MFVIIRNDASCLRFFAYLVGRPMTEDRSDLNYKFEQILDCFSLFTGRKADIHINVLDWKQILVLNYSGLKAGRQMTDDRSDLTKHLLSFFKSRISSLTRKLLSINDLFFHQFIC
ncbi:hypothetical protein SAMN04489723_11043 [Algoriphagus aquimarinus]|uniref:Uncharacterized protein n=1 Tax=Algoriphagus aquimarinus TaxID=237018 RepID=A0A1I1B3P0_9BACT|nr:hypothetical protein SAMN04489723_11043 [Algoriphagus aquimarinus]